MWIKHFSELFFDKSKSTDTQPNFTSSDLPNWPPVMPMEIIQIIDQLISGKAAGPDQIPPELLKCDPEWWAHLLAPFFTTIDRTGLVSKDWVSATNHPSF